MKMLLAALPFLHPTPRRLHPSEVAGETPFFPGNPLHECKAGAGRARAPGRFRLAYKIGISSRDVRRVEVSCLKLGRGFQTSDAAQTVTLDLLVERTARDVQPSGRALDVAALLL